MTSVASLTDFGLSRERYLSYLETPVKSRPEFAEFDGALFVDSGGYKLLNEGSLSGTNFSIETSQKLIHGIQRAFGADIAVNLDLPFEESDVYRDRVSKTEATASFAAEFVNMDAEGSRRYLTVHGYSKAMLDRFFDTVARTLPGPIDQFYDGIAFGGLVPKKDDLNGLINAVSSLKTVLAERNLSHLPIHVLGISGRAMPLLIALGVDTFDSSTYLHSAINGKYSTSLFTSTNVAEADFDICDCPVCTSPALRQQMRGDAEYQKDILGPVAVHNLILQQQFVKRLRRSIAEGNREQLRTFLENAYQDRPQSRKFAYRVINQTLGSYF